MVIILKWGLGPSGCHVVNLVTCDFWSFVSTKPRVKTCFCYWRLATLSYSHWVDLFIETLRFRIRIPHPFGLLVFLVSSIVGIFMAPSPPTVLILGHSFVKRLRRDLSNGFDQRVNENFHLHGIGGCSPEASTTRPSHCFFSGSRCYYFGNRYEWPIHQKSRSNWFQDRGFSSNFIGEFFSAGCWNLPCHPTRSNICPVLKFQQVSINSQSLCQCCFRAIF